MDYGRSKEMITLFMSSQILVWPSQIFDGRESNILTSREVINAFDAGQTQQVAGNEKSPYTGEGKGEGEGHLLGLR